MEKEIRHFCATRSADRIILLLSEGELLWDTKRADFDWSRTSAVPASLAGVFDAEPLYIDLRFARKLSVPDMRHSEFRRALAQVAAPLRGRAPDELESDDVRLHRKAIRLASFAMTILAILIMATTISGIVCQRAAHQAQENEREAKKQTERAAEKEREAFDKDRQAKARKVEVDCLRYERTEKWSDLELCSERLSVTNATAAKEFKSRAVTEICRQYEKAKKWADLDSCAERLVETEPNLGAEFMVKAILETCRSLEKDGKWQDLNSCAARLQAVDRNTSQKFVSEMFNECISNHKNPKSAAFRSCSRRVIAINPASAQQFSEYAIAIEETASKPARLRANLCKRFDPDNHKCVMEIDDIFDFANGRPSYVNEVRLARFYLIQTGKSSTPSIYNANDAMHKAQIAEFCDQIYSDNTYCEDDIEQLFTPLTKSEARRIEIDIIKMYRHPEEELPFWKHAARVCEAIGGHSADLRQCRNSLYCLCGTLDPLDPICVVNIGKICALMFPNNARCQEVVENLIASRDRDVSEKCPKANADARD